MAKIPRTNCFLKCLRTSKLNIYFYLHIVPSSDVCLCAWGCLGQYYTWVSITPCSEGQPSWATGTHLQPTCRTENVASAYLRLTFDGFTKIHLESRLSSGSKLPWVTWACSLKAFNDRTRRPTAMISVYYPAALDFTHRRDEQTQITGQWPARTKSTSSRPSQHHTCKKQPSPPWMVPFRRVKGQLRWFWPPGQKVAEAWACISTFLKRLLHNHIWWTALIWLICFREAGLHLT